MGFVVLFFNVARNLCVLSIGFALGVATWREVPHLEWLIGILIVFSCVFELMRIAAEDANEQAA